MTRPAVYIDRVDIKFCLERNNLEWLTASAKKRNCSTSRYLNELLAQAQAGTISLDLAPFDTLIDGLFRRLYFGLSDLKDKNDLRAIFHKYEQKQEPLLTGQDAIDAILPDDDNDEKFEEDDRSTPRLRDSKGRYVRTNVSEEPDSW